jgi:hypothetical protein
VSVDIAVVSAKHQTNICAMVTLVILTIYMEMTMSKTVVIELDFTYTPNEEDVYVYLKELMEDRSLSWELKDE